MSEFKIKKYYDVNSAENLSCPLFTPVYMLCFAQQKEYMLFFYGNFPVFILWLWWKDKIAYLVIFSFGITQCSHRNLNSLLV